MGGCFSVAPAGSATAFSVTEVTEVALEATATCAWRAVGVLPGVEVVHVAVLLPDPQSENSATGPAGWALSLIVMVPVGLATFWVQTWSPKVPDWPR